MTEADKQAVVRTMQIMGEPGADEHGVYDVLKRAVQRGDLTWSTICFASEVLEDMTCGGVL